MTKTLRIPDYLGHILQAIERIDRYTVDANEASFLANELIQDAVIRNLEIIGEAANKILKTDAEFAAAHSQVPWQVMYAMRNRLSHGYDTVDFEIVWKTIQFDLRGIYESVEATLK